MKSLKIKLPKRAKSWTPLYPIYANGKKLTFRERMIYEAGFLMGQDWEKHEKEQSK